MCISVNKAKLSGTKIMSLPLENGNHFLAYSNKVQNQSDRPNAMILPIPGKVKQEWFYNTEKYKNFLEEITEKCDHEQDYLGIRSRGISKGFKSLSHFDLGMYHIVISDSFLGVLEYIAGLPEHKRPEISQELQKFFYEKYSGWSFAVCMFSSYKAIDAQPIALEYTPFNYDLLYFPTVDAHDGNAPNLNERVDTDHTFIYEHTGPKNPKYEYVMETIDLKAEVPAFLQKKAYRTVSSHSKEMNGDTYIGREALSKTPFEEDPFVYRGKPIPAPALT